MSYDREQVESIWKRRRLERNTPDHRPALDALVQAEVSAAALTGSPEWDRFLSILQGAINASMAQAEGFSEIALSPDIYDPIEREAARINYIRASERVAAWEAALDLPADIIRASDAARLKIDRLNGQDQDRG